VAEESDLEKTEPASARRLEQAREEGNIPQSRELMAFMVLAAGAATFWVLGSWIAQSAANLVRHGLSFTRGEAFDTSVMSESALVLTVDAFALVAPIFIAIIAVIVLTPFTMGGPAMSAKAFQLDLTRMDPIKGFGRMFSWHSIGELVKAILKALLIGGVLYWIVGHEQGQIFALLTQPIEVGLAGFSRILFFSFVSLSAGLALIAAIDVPFQLWQYHEKLKMTREELKKEARESEGDPQLKARIRSQQREMARSRMMSQVPKADVVVTNPTHFAVALKYDRATSGAPVVVAKGMNLIAERIREIAGASRVPLLEAPPLARALYRHAEVGDQIPAALYSAVAEVMAWVYQMNEFAASAGNSLLPVVPELIAVPEGFDPGAVE
jgi:flagellar biosynthetic protein FlhB